MHALPIPRDVLADDDAVHLLGAWIAGEGLHCALNYGFFEGNGHDEAQAWGSVLADMIRHIAMAHAQQSGQDPTEVLASLMAALKAGLDDPQEPSEGEFVARPH